MNVRNRFVLIGLLVLLFPIAAACALQAYIPPFISGTQEPTPLAFITTPTRTPFQPLPAESTPPAPVLPDAAASPAEQPATLPAVPASATAPAAAPTAAEAPLPSSTGQPPADVPAGAALTVWVDPRLPLALRQAIELPDQIRTVDAPQDARVRIELGGDSPAANWVYALAAPFPTIPQGVTLEELQRSWRGESTGPFAGKPLLMDEHTAGVFTALWGAPGDGSVQVLPAEELLAAAWDRRPSWALIPFEALQPRWKVLEVDGQSPVGKDFNPDTYPLKIPISIAGSPAAVETARTYIPATNRDAGKMTVVAMTGVTALVRATAFTMEQQGITYPGQDVRGWLREADITHISNEVPFAEDCPYPNPVQPDLRFCSNPRYIKLLEDVGTDVVELTGDHFQDWGSRAMLFTLELYEEMGWPYYGGGRNREEARAPLLLEHNGNRIAFIGCNAKGGGFAQAGPNHPGAVACDMDWMAQEISRLRAEGYLPVATFQHFEYYTYRAQPNQERDARRLAEAGAVIVSGSQAHQPQGMAFDEQAFIHHGLGNLFFDQYEVSYACRQAFIDRHIFYDGRHISTELLPILFIDYARPRPMTAGEREELLNAVFSASGW